MQTFALQTILLLLIAYVLGCIIGCWLRGAIGRRQESAAGIATGRASAGAAPASVRAAPVTASTGAVAAAKTSTSRRPARTARTARTSRAPARGTPARAAPAAKSAASKAIPGKPAARRSAAKKPKASRAKKADDLKRIKGIGKVIEDKLNAMGITRYEQIAKWKRADVQSVDEKLNFKGRIDREAWIAQAKELAKER